MNLAFIEEPELEFGAGRHIDIRFGIMDYGPRDFDLGTAPSKIKLGIIGTKDSIEGVRRWFERCRTEISPKGDSNKPNRQPKLFTRFPGFASDCGYRSTLFFDDGCCRNFATASMDSICKLANRNERISRSVDLFMEEIQYLAQNKDVNVIVCAVPLPLLEAMERYDLGEEDNEDDDAPVTGSVAIQLDFHDMLKARAMQQYRKPIQIMLPSTYDPSKQRQQTRTGRKHELQDEATRAWNIHTALYYKAGGIPWRLPHLSTDLSVCYIGVNFYRSLDKESLLTSVAQVFNELGEGVVIRGGSATISKEDRQPHLPESQAYDLLANALARYREVHKTFPARVVIHKSSHFDASEKKGFEAALTDKAIATSDFLWISSSQTRLYRAGKYPPLRGTLLMLDDQEMLLYTKGSVDFFETYPGKYIPNPLRIRLEKAEQTQRYLAHEVLALSKMNWNNTQFDGADPVTLRASRNCSNVLRYCSEGRQIEPRYAFYM